MKYLIFTFVILCSNLAFAEKVSLVTANGSYQYTENGELKGPAVEIVKQLFFRSGIEYDLRVYPWVRAKKLFEEQPNTLLFSFIRTKERESKYHWIGKIDDSPFYVYKLKRNAIKTSDFRSLRDYKFGVIRNDIIDKYLKNKNFNNVTRAPNPQQHMRKFLLGRFDLMAFQAASLPLICKKAGISPDLLEPVLRLDDIGSGIYLVANKKTSPKVVQELKINFEAMVKSGFVKKTVDNWHY